jgi:NADPH-dependent 2,4-dienoyl-CoA reductase/sulfur reductase-like enzyme
MLLLAAELGCDPTEILKDRSGSWIAQKSSRQAPALQSGVHHKVQSLSSGAGAPTLEKVRLLIIGGGAAGLAAACSAHEAGVPAQEILLVDRQSVLGGILPQCSHHGFGRREQEGSLSGPQFLAPLLEEFSERGMPSLLQTTVTALSAERTVHLAGPAGASSFRAQSVVFACGCRERPLGSLPVTGSRPSGIFTAGAAQRMVNLQHWDIGHNIVILGSGDVGMVMAGTLTQQGKRVEALVEQAADATGLKSNRKRYVDDKGLLLLAHHRITRVFGHRRLEGVELEDLLTKQRTRLNCDTLIVSVGLVPETDLLQDLSSLTSPALYPPWLFLAGNARRVHSFIESVVADGAAAGLKAASFLAD